MNVKKTEVLYQPNFTRTREEDIVVDGNKLNSVLEFTYLGSTISSNGCIDDEKQRRLVLLSADYARDNDHMSMRVKGKIYRAIVLSTLKNLHAFMMRSIMKITWMDNVTNKDTFERTGLPSMEDLLIRKLLR